MAPTLEFIRECDLSSATQFTTLRKSTAPQLPGVAGGNGDEPPSRRRSPLRGRKRPDGSLAGVSGRWRRSTHGLLAQSVVRTLLTDAWPAVPCVALVSSGRSVCQWADLLGPVVLLILVLRLFETG